MTDIIKTAETTTVTYTATRATYTTSKAHGIQKNDSVTIAGLSPAGYNGTFFVTDVDSVNNTFTVANTTNATVTDQSGTVTLPRFSAASGSHIHNTSNVDLTLDFNSPIDELRFAFSVVNVDSSQDTGDDGSDIAAVRLMVKFGDTHETDDVLGSFAQIDIEKTSAEVDFTTDRYFTVSKQLQELSRFSNFTWNNATVVLVYASVLDSSGNTLDNYYVAIDGLRLENVSSINPLYGLVGYSVIQNVTQGSSFTYAQPIIKLPNTSNFIEFRYALDVI
jgi:hypothetical protein